MLRMVVPHRPDRPRRPLACSPYLVTGDPSPRSDLDFDTRRHVDMSDPHPPHSSEVSPAADPCPRPSTGSPPRGGPRPWGSRPGLAVLTGSTHQDSLPATAPAGFHSPCADRRQPVHAGSTTSSVSRSNATLSSGTCWRPSSSPCSKATANVRQAVSSRAFIAAPPPCPAVWPLRPRPHGWPGLRPGRSHRDRRTPAECWSSRHGRRAGRAAGHGPCTHRGTQRE